MDDEDGSPFNKTSGTLPHGTTGYTFTGVTKGRNYTIELVATNNIGSTALSSYFNGSSIFKVEICASIINVLSRRICHHYSTHNLLINIFNYR